MEETGEVAASCCSKSEEPKNKIAADHGVETKVKKKKMVRFKLNEENQGDSKNGVVRIRLVVTQKELKQILSCRKDLKQQNSSMEQLIKVMKLRGIRVSDDDHEDGFHGGWRPALESIPEEH
ncbi:hypothetical protein CCACVL1_16156 [Corchorus capsularis]|uniref:Uncharacterized protein n=1 Tax=Corchorus capsularis TaxID=210143 RepID=A0A1R3HYR7_COCAP|nr:hypothetical protein CCACVL1_16156 [Corchorus capsularis]